MKSNDFIIPTRELTHNYLTFNNISFIHNIYFRLLPSSITYNIITDNKLLVLNPNYRYQHAIKNISFDQSYIKYNSKADSNKNDCKNTSHCKHECNPTIIRHQNMSCKFNVKTEQRHLNKYIVGVNCHSLCQTRSQYKLKQSIDISEITKDDFENKKSHTSDVGVSSLPKRRNRRRKNNRNTSFNTLSIDYKNEIRSKRIRIQIQDKQDILVKEQNKLDIVQAKVLKHPTNIKLSLQFSNSLDKVENAEKNVRSLTTFISKDKYIRYRKSKIPCYTKSRRYSPRNHKRSTNCITIEDKNSNTLLLDNSDNEEEELLIEKNLWVYDMKSFDDNNESYGRKSLIIIYGNHKLLSFMSWGKMKNLSTTFIAKTIQNILIIPRSIYGQMYIIKGLHNALHFSLGQQGTTQLKLWALKMNITQNTLNGISIQDTASYKLNNCTSHNKDIIAYVKTIDPINTLNFEQRYMNAMKACCNELWYVIFRKNQNVNQRANQIINLGITSSKIDQLERISITGRVSLNIIESSTSSKFISKRALKELGKLLMLVIDECLPTSNICNAFKIDSKYHRQYLDMFASQLQLDKESRSRFCIPAMSLLVNGDLKPHCDTMNPVRYENDYTLSLSVQISIDNLPTTIREKMRNIYPIAIPICLVIYNRKSLDHYAQRMLNIDNYVSDNVLSSTGRSRLVELLNNVNVYTDYQGTYFINKEYEILGTSYKKNEKFIYDDKTSSIKETVDSMVSIVMYILIVSIKMFSYKPLF